jgi:hypothetical protein
MVLSLPNGLILCTTQNEARTHIEHGKFREATKDETTSALGSFSPQQISADPLKYQSLAIAIASYDAYVGKPKTVTSH